jgi:WD40 repeat protein
MCIHTKKKDLFFRYPFVDFSSSSQKLAVGTLEGASVIYDVRTATRSIVLEGHTGPVCVLAFSPPDAKLIATCSLVDQSVRVWYTNLSLFGMLTSSLSHGLGGKQNQQYQQHTDGVTSGNSGSQKPYKVFSFAIPNSK